VQFEGDDVNVGSCKMKLSPATRLVLNVTEITIDALDAVVSGVNSTVVAVTAGCSRYPKSSTAGAVRETPPASRKTTVCVYSVVASGAKGLKVPVHVTIKSPFSDSGMGASAPRLSIEYASTAVKMSLVGSLVVSKSTANCTEGGPAKDAAQLASGAA
jgi:hypothetical protein